MAKPKYYIETSNQDTQAYSKAIAQSFILAEQDSNIKRIVLLLPKKDTLSNGLLNSIFPPATHNQLARAGMKIDADKPLIKVEASKSYSDSEPSSEIVIAIGISQDDLFDLEEFEAIAAIIAIPWFHGELEKWVRTWNPIIIQGQALHQPYPSPSCITRVAMRYLTEYGDRSKSINSDPREQPQTAIYLATLHNYDSPINPEVVGAYLINTLNWRAKKAREAEAIMVSINGGRFPKGGKPSKGHYDRCKAECAQSKTVTLLVSPPTVQALS